MSAGNGYYNCPRKIMITLAPSVVLTHPFSLVMDKMSVMRFQRSLCDPHSTSNGFLREMLAKGGGSYSTASLGTLRSIAASIYRSEGFFGFFRGLPEYVSYHLSIDVLSYLIPKYVLPAFAGLRLPVPRLPAFNLFDTGHVMGFSLARFGEGSTAFNLVNFFKQKLSADTNKILTSLIIELVTYPALTIISRLMIYDGYAPVGFYPLLKHTIAVEGVASLYRGFLFRLLKNALAYASRHFATFVRQSPLYGSQVDPITSQTLLGISTVAQSVLDQLSLILRCGSKIDGFCVDYDAVEVMRRMPWRGIMVQTLASIALVRMRESLVEDPVEKTIEAVVA